MNLIPLPRMSDFIVYDFMIPMNLTIKDLSDGTGIPYKETQAVLNNETEITPELSEKLGAFFGVSDMMFYNIQQDLKKRANFTERQYAHSEHIAEYA